MNGRRLGDYEIIGELGEGGMGKVYLAKNTYLSSMLVVLKVLKNQEQRERFLGEVGTLSRLNHQNVCQLRHFFLHLEELVIAMEYIDGKTLSVLAREWRDIDLMRIREIFIQILAGLASAHGMGIYHRDLKPSNIMIDKGGTAKIIDFGVARHIGDTRFTSTGAAVGTPQYMAPEQFMSDRLTDFTQADIYSLGITLYELCCGRLPFEDTNPYVLKEKHCMEEPERPTVLNPRISPELEQVISKAIAKKPARRFASAREMQSALERVTFTNEAAAPTIITRTTGLRRWVRHNRNRVAMVAAGTVILVLVVAILLTTDHTIAPISRPTDVARPSISLPSQTITQSEEFQLVDLAGKASDGSEQGAKWQYRGNKHLVISPVGSNKFSISVPDKSWHGSDTVCFLAIYPSGRKDSAYAVYSVVGVERTPRVSGTVVQQRLAGSAFDPIYLDDYLSEDDRAEGMIRWDYDCSKSELSIRIDQNRVAHVNPQPGWVGQARVTFRATNRYGKSDTLFADFKFLAARPEPQKNEIKQKPSAPVDTARPETIVVATPPPKPSYQVVKLRVQSSGSEIRNDLGKKFTDTAVDTVSPGKHEYRIYNRDFPIQKVIVDASSQPVDTTLVLNLMVNSSEKGNLAVSVVTSQQERIPRRIILNGFLTQQVSQGYYQVFSGDYDVSIDLGNELRIDSVAIERQQVTSKKPTVTVSPGRTTLVSFFVTKVKPGKP